MLRGTWTGICSVVAVAAALSFDIRAASAQNGTTLIEYVRPDGKIENYYTAMDPNLEHGLTAAHLVFSDIAINHRKWSRAGLDEYVPFQLKRWRNRAAEEVMRVLRDEFFARQNGNTGLVPTFASGVDRASGYDRTNTMSVRFPYYAARLLEWFPDDALTRSQAHALASATMTYFSPTSGAGLLNVINVETGEAPRPTPESPPVNDIVVYGMDYGLLAQGMAMLASQLDHASYWTWAAPRIGHVWQHRGSSMNVLSERYNTYGPDLTDPNTSTDSHYLIRWAHEGTRLASSDPILTGYLEKAAQKWYDSGWYPGWQQCARYLSRQAGAPVGNAIFGDGKWNCQYLYNTLYRMTGDPQIIERMLEHWEQLLSQSRNGNGLLIDTMEAGVGVVIDDPDPAKDEGDSLNQAIMLDALVDGYEATGETQLLSYATALAAAIRTTPTWPVVDALRDNTARPFLRLAEASNGPIGRLEVEFPAWGGNIVIKRTNGAVVFSKVLPRHAAVVYLPRGNYRVELTLGSSTRSATIHVSPEGTAVSYLPGATGNLVQGYVIRDLDDDGVIDAGETGAPLSRAYIDTNQSGTYNGGEPHVVIAGSGWFSLPASNTVMLRATLPSSAYRWSRSSPNPSGSNPGHLIQFHSTGLAVTVHAFTVTQRMRVSGKVFHDVYGGGTQQPGEPSLTGSVVYLDANANNTRDFGEPYAETATDGTYSLGGLTTGGRVRIVSRSRLPITTTPASGYHFVAFSTAQHITGKNFGVR